MKKILLVIATLLMSYVGMAQETYHPTAENLKAREQFQDEKFGIFLHWGLYSMVGAGEWVMTNRDINYKEYPKLAKTFYPSEFDADAWVKAIKAAGARYITITTRHHDGFSLFKTTTSTYNSVDGTPFKRDIIKEMADACQRNGIKLHLYYSHLDWGREDYPQGRTGLGTGRDKGKANWSSYYKFMNTQLTELLTHYGPIGAVWFDGWWDHDSDAKPFDWQLPEQYAMIHRLQPQCLIGNNHHQTPLSPKDLIQMLVRAAGKNANLLLNIGPEPGGALPSLALDRLQAIGKWLNKYGETIYGTRGGIVAPHDWGVSTQRGNKLYIHILNCTDSSLFIPTGNHKIKSATVFGTNKRVNFIKTGNGITLNFTTIPTDIDYIVELTLG